jgi:hypothetical protein
MADLLPNALPLLSLSPPPRMSASDGSFYYIKKHQPKILNLYHSSLHLVKKFQHHCYRAFKLPLQGCHIASKKGAMIGNGVNFLFKEIYALIPLSYRLSQSQVVQPASLYCVSIFQHPLCKYRTPIDAWGVRGFITPPPLLS